MTWWTDGAMVNCGLPGDEGFVGDAETPDDAQRIVDQHNATLAAARSSPAPAEGLDALRAQIEQAERDGYEQGRHARLAEDAQMGLDEVTLTAVLDDWMPDGGDVSVGFDGQSQRLTGGDLARYLIERASEYRRLPTTKKPIQKERYAELRARQDDPANCSNCGEPLATHTECGEFG